MQGVYVLVFGRVQGVGFRKVIEKSAKDLNISGFVQNLNDGSVLIEAEGEKENLEKFLINVNHGSFLSSVESVYYKWVIASQRFTGFELKRDVAGIFNDQVKSFITLGRKLLFENKNYKPDQCSQDLTVFPKHLVIIPDGNRRWAKERFFPTLEGHRVGIVKRFKGISDFFYTSPIQVLTLWCFSTENWNREKYEVDYLMDLFIESIEQFEKDYEKHGVVFRHLGRKTHLPEKVLKKISELENRTKCNGGKTICLAIDYGGQDEIVRAIQNISNSKDISIENFGDHLDTKGLPEPDFIVRTSGEQRLSGIFPWQGVYAELYFTEKHFPDFDRDELFKALCEFQDRKRRFGK